MNNRVPGKRAVPPQQPAAAPTPPAPRVWTSLDLINWTRDYFTRKGIESPRLEAELLLAEVLGCPRIRLYSDFEKPVDQEKLARFREFVKRRGDTREPIQYIIGHTDFIDVRIKVSKAVLIPRPETELLAVWALECLKESAGAGETSRAPRVLDLCTGSGCLAVYLAARCPSATVVAGDLSSEALVVAKENAAAAGVSERVEFREGDLFSIFKEEERGSFDLIVSNPPYVDPAMREGMQVEVRDHEPALALFAEEKGLAVLRRLLDGAAEWLRPGGWIGAEFGHGQGDSVRAMAAAQGGLEAVEIRPDQARIPRFVLARRRA